MITITTTVDEENFTLVTVTKAKFLGQTYDHTETTDMTDVYNMFIGQMVKDGWLEDGE